MKYKQRPGRPLSIKKIKHDPAAYYFKPRGVPLSILEEIELNLEELEALRLKNIINLDQKDCAREMNTSPATLQRILSRAYAKISDAIVNGKAIKIEESDNF